MAMEVEWRQVGVCLAKKQILAPCSGSLGPGQMTALMGPSGSGKSTLLNCLRQDIPHSGEVRFNGSRFSPALRQLIGYAEQDDVVIPGLTVRQTLSFLAELRYGFRSTRAAEKVVNVLSSVRLEHCADRMVGDANSSARISGGERKRLCIARELLAEPTLLLCDEPTSGLDSTMAAQVVATLRALCDSGEVTVLSSIHQPSTDSFLKFDRLVLLKDGQMLYNGETSEAESVFRGYGLYRHPSQSTPEYLMNYLVLGVDETGGMPEDTMMLLAKDVASRSKRLSSFGLPRRLSKGIELPYDPPFCRQLLMLVTRHGGLQLHETTSSINITQMFLLTLVPSLLWAQLDNTDADVYPRMTVCTWLLGTWMFFPLFACLGFFQENRSLMVKELRLGCYSVNAMYIARTLLLLPIDLLWPTFFATGLFWTTGINRNFGVYIQILLMTHTCFILFSGIGLCMSASGLKPSRAHVCALTLIIFAFSWSGLFRDMSGLPEVLQWVGDGNIFMYMLQGMMHIVIHDGYDFMCGFIVKSDRAYDRNNSGCIVNADGDFILPAHAARKRLGIDKDMLLSIVISVSSAMLCRALALALLHYDLWSTVYGAKEEGLKDDAGDPAKFSHEEATLGPKDHAIHPPTLHPPTLGDDVIAGKPYNKDLACYACEDDIAIQIRGDPVAVKRSSTMISI